MDEYHGGGKKAIVIYGTASGNAELVSDCISCGLQESGINAQLVRAEKIRTDVKRVAEYDLIVLVSSTYNTGKLQEYLEPFYNEFIKLELPGKPMAVVGLGDSKYYDIFCGAADYLEDALKAVGGRQLLPTLRIDGAPEGRAQEFEEWGKRLAKSIE